MAYFNEYFCVFEKAVQPWANEHMENIATNNYNILPVFFSSGLQTVLFTFYISSMIFLLAYYVYKFRIVILSY